MAVDYQSLFDLVQALSIGGLSAAVLVMALTETIKTLSGIEGNAVRIVALALGVLFSALAYGMTQGLIPPAAHPYIEWAVTAIGGGAASMGLWHLADRFLGGKGAGDDRG